MTDTTPLSVAAVDQLCEARFAQLILASQEFRHWALSSAYAHLHAAFPDAHWLRIELSEPPERRCRIDSIATLDNVQLYRCGDNDTDMQQVAVRAAEDRLNDALTTTPHHLPPGWQAIEDQPGLVDLALDITAPELDEQDGYLAAVADALACGADGAARLGRYLTTMCPECDAQPGSEFDHHVLSLDGHVLIGCEDYFVVNPNLVGLNRPLWDDWTIRPTTPPLTTSHTTGQLAAAADSQAARSAVGPDEAPRSDFGGVDLPSHETLVMLPDGPSFPGILDDTAIHPRDDGSFEALGRHLPEVDVLVRRAVARWIGVWLEARYGSAQFRFDWRDDFALLIHDDPFGLAPDPQPRLILPDADGRYRITQPWLHLTDSQARRISAEHNAALTKLAGDDDPVATPELLAYLSTTLGGSVEPALALRLHEAISWLR